MCYEYHPANTNIINIKERGTKFYILIQGKVSVHIPKNFRRESMLHTTVNPTCTETCLKTESSLKESETEGIGIA